MKTNPSARTLVRTQRVLFCLAILALAGLAFPAGAALAARVGQVSVRQNANPAPPNFTLADLMAAGR